MSERFFSEQPITGDTASLVGGEAHHLLHVMRLKTGDRAVLFDGHGAEFDAEVERSGRSDVELRVIERREVDRERSAPLVLGVALPKGDRQKVLIEKLTELGVTRVAPLVTEHGVALPKGNALDKLRRGVIEASKQCGRNRLMEITEPLTLAEFLLEAPAEVQRWLAHPNADCPAAKIEGEIWCAIGPEGGFSDVEVQLARDAGFEPISLGHTILRIETAAITVAAIAR